LDAILGDASLFIRRDMLIRSWEIIDPLERHWLEQRVIETPSYEAGTWGPVEADLLLQRSGHVWRRA
jgi:glucose-6-phosphate 1-dehydrogenase